MSDYKPGTVAVIAADFGDQGFDNTRAFRIENGWATEYGEYHDRYVSEVRPLVVLDLDFIRSKPYGLPHILQDLRFAVTGGSHIADQIEAQAMPPKPRCVAHGDEECTHCSRISSSDLTGDGGCKHCEVYASDGMHWDTCPGRIRGVIFPSRDAAALSEGVQP